eukprot:TRINITY_DN67158_c0_g1_i1.p1 TRINITY_DN67158_c0_g1~~TRINITY_DN67158_c0_g1_i1.p1  ORF type:complete len:468 (-),score=57.34 TRINITY_DN67158_c0_g1_i1:135-1403(-)
MVRHSADATTTMTQESGTLRALAAASRHGVRAVRSSGNPPKAGSDHTALRRLPSTGGCSRTTHAPPTVIPLQLPRRHQSQPRQINIQHEDVLPRNIQMARVGGREPCLTSGDSRASSTPCVALTSDDAGTSVVNQSVPLHRPLEASSSACRVRTPSRVAPIPRLDPLVAAPSPNFRRSPGSAVVVEPQTDLPAVEGVEDAGSRTLCSRQWRIDESMFRSVGGPKSDVPPGECAICCQPFSICTDANVGETVEVNGLIALATDASNIGGGAALALPCALAHGCPSFFHTTCIRAWLERSPSCPLCRRSMKQLARPVAPAATRSSPSRSPQIADPLLVAALGLHGDSSSGALALEQPLSRAYSFMLHHRSRTPGSALAGGDALFNTIERLVMRFPQPQLEPVPLAAAEIGGLGRVRGEALQHNR